MKSLVAYYSWTGNTEVVANEIRQLTGADLKKIEEVKPRKSGIGFAGAALSAIIGLKSKLKPMDFTLKSYDTVFLGGPIWASSSAPAMNSYINQADLKGKKVYLFLTEGDDKIPQKVIDSITKRIDKRGGKVAGNIFITTKMNSVIAPEAVKGAVSEWIRKEAIK